MLTNKHKKLNVTGFLKSYGIISLTIAGIALLVFGCENNQPMNPLLGMKSEKMVTGRLTGRVTRGPMSPIVRNDMPSTYKPVDGVKLAILNPLGKEVQSAVTDKEGNYRADLPPGTYRVEIPPSPLGWTKDLPAEVTINEKEETQLDIRLDSGMR